MSGPFAAAGRADGARAGVGFVGVGAFGELDAAVEEHLHAHADAEHGAAAGQAGADQARALDAVETLHAGGVGADAGDEQPVGVLDGVRVGGDDDVDAGGGHGALGGAQIAGAVVEDCDGGHVEIINARFRRAPRAPREWCDMAPEEC